MTLELFSFTRNYFSWHMCNTQRKKKLLLFFFFIKHPIQNKRLLRLQAVCCNSLACSKNNKPHEGVCSLASASLLGLAPVYFVPSMGSDMTQSALNGHPQLDTCCLDSRTLPFESTEHPKLKKPVKFSSTQFVYHFTL